MKSRPRGRLFHADEFTLSEFTGSRLTGLVLWQDPDNGEAAVVHIKIDRRPWQRFFLDAGFGTWEDWGELEPGGEVIEDPDIVEAIDKLQEFGIADAVIRRIFCEPCANNARIVIELDGGARVILQPTEPEILGSPSELVMLRP